MITRVVVPVDFTERSREAVEYAAAIAIHFGASVLLAHVAEPSACEFSFVEAPAPHAGPTAPLREELEKFGAAELKGLRVTRQVLEGDPADQVLCAARREHADLIVMPTRGRSRMRQFLIGSVTAKVLHDAPVPVWTGVHLNPQSNFPNLQVREILCAIDFGVQTDSVLRYAAQLMREFNAHLTVMHVAEDEHRDIHGMINERLRRLGVDAAIRIEEGQPHKLIAAAAGSLHADVVVIGRACSTGMMGRLREQAYAIVRDSPCPVLSV